MRSIHTTNQQDHKNNTPYRVIHQHRTKLGNPIRSIIVSRNIISIAIISLLALSLSLCLSSTYTHAENSVSLSVDNNDVVLELTVPTSVNLNLTPNSTNDYTSFGTTNLNVSAGTNNPYGYTLTMSVPNTNLVNSSVTLSSSNNPNNIPLDNDNHPVIPTITSTYSDSNFPNNAWGYKLPADTNYYPIPSNMELASTNSAGNATTITLELAAKVNSTQPAGIYNTTLNFNIIGKKALPNPADITDLGGTTWYINDTLPLMDLQPMQIDFDTQDGEFFQLLRVQRFKQTEEIYYNQKTRAYSNGWQDESYRTITIYGGADASNQDFIDWLRANATLIDYIPIA